MSQESGQPDQKAREVEYYKKQLEALSGELLNLEYSQSSLRHTLKQKQQGFSLLTKLQEAIAAFADSPAIFEAVVEQINAQLSMDRSVVLVPTGREHCYRPAYWFGFPKDEAEKLGELSLEFPGEFSQGKKFYLVNKTTDRTTHIEELQSLFKLRTFICLPVVIDGEPVAILLSGRMREEGLFAPPVDEKDVDTFRAIAGLIVAFRRNLQVNVLQEMDELKTRFFANVSHEFRTPITLTLGPLKELIGGAYGELPVEARRQLFTMQRNQERLLTLINQLLDLAKLEAGKMEMKFNRIENINRYIEERAEQFRLSAEKKGLELNLLLDPVSDTTDIYIDREKFERVLFNLLSNALKFTEEGSIEICTGIEDGKFTLEVNDSGIGIKKENLSTIFDRFRQADQPETQQQSGTGIGLALVKELVQLHGGEVSVSSRYGEGSSFRVTLPVGGDHLDPATIVEVDESELPKVDSTRNIMITHEAMADHSDAEKRNKETEEKFDSGKSTLLYVEDNPDLRNYVSDLLAAQYNVFLAYDGEDGLEKVRKYKPDLVIADQMMPGMSGGELLRAMRGDENLRVIPVIFLTARSGTESRIETLQAGADDYIAKPFDKEELLARVRNILRVHEQERELTKLNRILESRIEDQMAKLRLAGKIQRDLLPSEKPEIPGYDIAGNNIPADAVGGDYYDFIPMENNRYAICLGDVSGKGLPAALLMANVQATMRGQSLDISSPKECITKANSLICRSTADDKFITLFLGILNANDHTITFTNAGHDLPYFLNRNGAVQRLQTDGLVLGMMDGVPYEEDSISFNPGDCLVMHSDGITEAMNPDGEDFGEEKLEDIIKQNHTESSDVMLERIISAVEFHTRGTPQSDDVTLVVVKRNIN